MVWRGRSPEGLWVEVDRDPAGHWVVTVSKAVRSRRYLLREALHEAAGPAVSLDWLDELARTLEMPAISKSAPLEPPANRASSTLESRGPSSARVAPAARPRGSLPPTGRGNPHRPSS
jgi:hypothetical protein